MSRLAHHAKTLIGSSFSYILYIQLPFAFHNHKVKNACEHLKETINHCGLNKPF